MLLFVLIFSPSFFNVRCPVCSWWRLTLQNIYTGYLSTCRWQCVSQVKILFYEVSFLIRTYCSWVAHSQDSENNFCLFFLLHRRAMCHQKLWMLENLWYLVSPTNHYLEMCLFLDTFTLSQANCPKIITQDKPMYSEGNCHNKLKLTKINSV